MISQMGAKVNSNADKMFKQKFKISRLLKQVVHQKKPENNWVHQIGVRERRHSNTKQIGLLNQNSFAFKPHAIGCPPEKAKK